MADLDFSSTIVLDGVTFDANRQPDPQLFGRMMTPTRQYEPKVAGPLVDASGAVQLDPAPETTWHRGAGATRPVVPGMYSWTKNGWACDPGLLMPGPLVTQVPLANFTGAVPVRGVWEQDGDLWAVAGRYVNRFTGGSSAPTVDQDLGAGPVASAAKPYQQSVYVDTGSAGGNIWQRPNGGAWNQTVPSGAGVKRGPLATVWWNSGSVQAERLVGASSLYGLRYTNGGDPRVDANWTPGVSQVEITISQYPIQTFVTTQDHLYTVTTGGIYDLDVSGMAPLLTPETEAMVMATNGLASLAAGGKIYANYGYGLIRVPVTGTLGFAQSEWVTPMVGLPNETPVAGYGTALVRRGNWLIYAMFDPTTFVTYVCWGRDAVGDEVGPMTWHVAPIVLAGQKVTALWVSGLVSANPRLWLFTIDQSNVVSAWWAPLALATPYQDIRQGRAYRCATSFDFYTTTQDWGDSAMPKDLEEEAVEGEGISGTSSFSFGVATDGSTAFTTLGTFNEGSRAVLPMANALLANRFQDKISGVGLSASPPILRKREPRAFPTPDQRQMRLYQLRVGRPVGYESGVQEGEGPERRIALLENLQVGTRATFQDEQGAIMTVKLRPGTLRFVEMGQQDADPILAAYVQLVVLSSAGGGSSIVLDTVGALDSTAWRLD